MNLQIGQGMIGGLISVPHAISWSSLAGGWRILFQDGWQVDAGRQLAALLRMWARTSFPLHGYLSITVLGHAHNMAAGFQGWAFQESRTEKYVKFLWHNLKTHTHHFCSTLCFWSRQSQRSTHFKGKGHRHPRATRSVRVALKEQVGGELLLRHLWKIQSVPPSLRFWRRQSN